MICVQQDFRPFHEKNNFCLICVSNGQKKQCLCDPNYVEDFNVTSFFCVPMFYRSPILRQNVSKCLGNQKNQIKNNTKLILCFGQILNFQKLLFSNCAAAKYSIVNRQRLIEFSNQTTNISCKCIKHFPKMSFHFFLIFHILKFFPTSNPCPPQHLHFIITMVFV